jgi:hypothetical protein
MASFMVKKTRTMKRVPIPYHGVQTHDKALQEILVSVGKFDSAPPGISLRTTYSSSETPCCRKDNHTKRPEQSTAAQAKQKRMCRLMAATEQRVSR